MPLQKLTVSNPIEQPIDLDPTNENVDTKVGEEKIIRPMNYIIFDKNLDPPKTKFYNAKTNSS